MWKRELFLENKNKKKEEKTKSDPASPKKRNNVNTEN